MSLPLPRFTDQTITHDPLEQLLAQRETERDRARTAINAGTWLAPDPADLRGIPCLAVGTSGATRGTLPHVDGIRNADFQQHRLGSRTLRR